ncbi:MAG: SUMF1/EgtB/PvdO family nonheme iron enzyme [bacterium]|nr:SUMF1/EgtB/PvdO family nonheme iron enzyme [bacterium]
MFRYLSHSTLVLFLVICFVAPVQAAEPFGLLDCTTDFSSEVVLNDAALVAMIPLTEPGGVRPDRDHETFFIVVKHYLQRVRGLLLIARGEAEQRPLLLTAACGPYPEAAAHIRTFFSELTVAQKQTLIKHRDMVWPRTHRTAVQIGAVAQIPAGDGLDAFSIEVHEVTNTQYRQFIEAGGYTTKGWWAEDGWAWLQARKRRQPSYWDSSQFKAPDQPVVGIAWYEADAYCRWAGKALPNERQWEKACQGEDGRKFPWGDEPLRRSQTETTSESDKLFMAPAVVGSMPQTQSPYGVHDMAGNVLEWTQTARDGQVVLCGGSGSSYTPNVGCGVRYTLLPGIAANFIGFRCQLATP